MQQIVIIENITHWIIKRARADGDGYQDHGTMYNKQSYKVRNYTSNYINDTSNYTNQVQHKKINT